MWRYLSLDGRATRIEFAAIFSMTACFVTVAHAWFVNAGRFPGTPAFVVFCASLFFVAWLDLAVTVRRCHDLNLSGWWYLSLLIPLAHYAVLFGLVFLPGTYKGNQYGLPHGWEGCKKRRKDSRKRRRRSTRKGHIGQTRAARKRGSREPRAGKLA